MNKERIAQKVEHWYKITEKGANNSVPLKTQVTHKPVTSPVLRHMQHKYTQLYNCQHTHKVGADKNTIKTDYLKKH